MKGRKAMSLLGVMQLSAAPIEKGNNACHSTGLPSQRPLTFPKLFIT